MVLFRVGKDKIRAVLIKNDICTIEELLFFGIPRTISLHSGRITHENALNRFQANFAA